MDPSLHNIVDRAFIFSSPVQLNGASYHSAVIKLPKCSTWCFEFALHVLETK